PTVVCPILVGRAAYLEPLRAAMDGLRAGKGHTLLIAGEAGIGKSRLVGEGRDLARRLGLPLLEGRCFEADSGLPYAPIVDLLGGGTNGHHREKPGRAASAPARIGALSGLSGRLAEASAGDAAEPGLEKRRLIRS